MEKTPEEHMTESQGNRKQRILLWLGFLLGFLWPMYRLINSSGWILDDEISHFLFSKAVVDWPEILLDEWPRPGRNLIHSIITPFGLTASRIFTLILSTLAVFFCYRVALRLNIRHAWSIPFLLCFQPWYPELSYPVLTQAPFMLVWILAVYLALNNRMHFAAFAFGYLSLIRHEGIFITALWGLWVICQPGGVIYHLLHKKKFGEVRKSLAHSILLGFSTISPIIILNLCAYFIQGRIPFAIYFDSNPTDIYGNGSLFHYVPMLRNYVGNITLSLSVIGMYFIFSNKLKNWSLILITYPAYFILHSVIYWKGSFASGGYYHFLMPMAPLFALLAALTISKFLTYDFKHAHYVTQARYLIGVFIFVIFCQGMHMASYQHNNQDWSNIMAGKASVKTSLLAPVDTTSRIKKQIREATHLAKSNSEPNNTFTHCAHVYFYYLTDQPDTLSFRNERIAPLSTFPIGSHYIWDSNYADLEPRTSHTELEKNSNWQSARMWTDTNGKPSVILFRKTNNSPYDEDLTPKGRNLSY
ncbi:MAG: hypothetical protein ACI9E1_001677 [Cryomorphaceae bacterium]|jgi:hypothetical protein